MTRMNRATPLGGLVCDPGRGLIYANRGCLHDADGRIRRRYNGRRWITCRLRFRDRRRSALMMPGRYTELFFLDEATAMAAGHRPCAECRRADYDRLTGLWRALHPGQIGADAIDAQLHRERIAPDGRSQRRHRAPVAELPDGAYVLGDDGEPCLVLGDGLLAWSPAGYRERRPRPRAGTVVVLTPPSLVAVLAAGWDGGLVALVHPSAGMSAGPAARAVPRAAAAGPMDAAPRASGARPTPLPSSPPARVDGRARA